VRREDFIPVWYRDHAYEELPPPLPGERATISCPHSYPPSYEPLDLADGLRFLEAGVGSGYGTALAREVVGREGMVVAIEIDATTLAFARENLPRAGHTNVLLVHGDGDSSISFISSGVVPERRFPIALRQRAGARHRSCRWDL
jgi:protein-L-isoaspartate(D-aspartate) O-methyltransferase